MLVNIRRTAICGRGPILGRLLALVSPIALFAAAPISHALDYDYRFNTTFSGTGPAGSAPWIEATFHDVASGTVSLVISNNGLSGSEFISGLYFNLNSNYNATSLSFQLMSGSIGSCATNIWTGRDQFKADGDGKYDILFDFDTASGHRFGAGDYLVYQISGISSLNVLDFEYLSAPAGGSGPFLAAAHVQSIGSDGSSGWVRPTEFSRIFPVPEPSSAALLGLASIVFLGVRRHSKR
jgi:hypothetical protein